MANWYGQSRSNYFKVKNVAAFKAWASALHLQVWSDGDEVFALADNSEGFWPHERWTERAGRPRRVSIAISALSCKATWPMAKWRSR